MKNNYKFKYMNLLNDYEEKILNLKVCAEYNSKLINFITKENTYNIKSTDWKSYTRKRMLALILFVHFY